MMDRGEMNTGNIVYREENYVGRSEVSGRMSLQSSLVPSYLSVVLVFDDCYSVEKKALCIFKSCNSLKFSMAEKQLRFSTCLPFFFFPSFYSPSLPSSSPSPPPPTFFYCSLFLRVLDWLVSVFLTSSDFFVFYQLLLKFPLHF